MIKYNRAATYPVLKAGDLRYGKFYRKANDGGTEPLIFLATDEETLVTLDGVQYRANGLTQFDFIEVDVDITVGGDL